MNVDLIRKDFPILKTELYGKSLIYLDNSATTQLPSQVLNVFLKHYQQNNANIHRGVHALSERSTAAYEAARQKTAQYLGCDSSEIVFTSGTTASINLLAQALSDVTNRTKVLFEPGDEIIVSLHEHHSNYLPWQQLANRNGLIFKTVPYKNGEFDLESFQKLLSGRTKLVAVAHVTNVTGAVNPIAEIAKTAHDAGALVLVDGAQGIMHEGIDVKNTDVDFYCFSGHKMYAPGGTGGMYINTTAVQYLSPPWYGGGMVDTVTPERTTCEPFPYCMEAGTPNYQGAIALGAAIDYVQEIGFADIKEYEKDLCTYAEEQLLTIKGLQILGAPKKRSSILSFVIKDVHPYDLAMLLDKCGIAVRSGSLCAQPALADLGTDFCTRISFAFYNKKEEIDCLCESINKALRMLLR